MKLASRYAIVLLALCLSTLVHAAPRHVYLTWADVDSSRTMQVNFQSMNGAQEGTVYYDTKPCGGDPEAYRKHMNTTGQKIPGLVDERTIHHANLTKLKPGKTYYFIAGNEVDGYSDEYTFRTIKRRTRKIRFITGGDMGVEGDVHDLLKEAGKLNPDFVAIGGDIAYGNGKLESVGKWDIWLDLWAKYMKDGNNRLIPIVAAIGNHETNDKLNDPRATAPFFTHYFEQAGNDTHFVRTFGKDLSLIALDTGHVETHESQVAWLDKTLAEHAHRQYTFAIYHIPLYPTVRDYESEWSKRGRDHWAPLFDKYELTVAFENHDHALKMTHAMKNGKAGNEGTMYLGDGCFGRPPRDVAEKLRWYQSHAESKSHFWLVELEKGKSTYSALGTDGSPILTIKRDESKKCSDIE